MEMKDKIKEKQKQKKKKKKKKIDLIRGILIDYLVVC